MTRRVVLTILLFVVVSVFGFKAYAEEIPAETFEEELPFVEAKIINGWIDQGKVVLEVEYTQFDAEPEYVWTDDLSVLVGEIKYGTNVLLATKENEQIIKMIAR